MLRNANYFVLHNKSQFQRYKQTWTGLFITIDFQTVLLTELWLNTKNVIWQMYALLTSQRFTSACQPELF